MRLKAQFLLVLTLLVSGVSLGQHVPQFTQYFFDPLNYNPAIAGSEQGFSATVIGRQQWVGFNGAPGTAVFNAHLPLAKIKSGMGLSVLSDQIGNFKTISASPVYAYKIRSGLNVISFGVAPVFTSSSVQDNWSAVDGKVNDTAIPQGNQSGTAIDANAGVFYKGGKYFGGISVLNLMGQRIKSMNFKQNRTLFVMAGYQFKFSQTVDWTAGFMYRAPMGAGGGQFDVNISGVLKEAFIFGINYRSKDAISPVLGFQKYIASGKIRIGYAYDYNTSTLTKQNTGSHEVALNYVYILNRSINRENEKYKNVRFL